LGEKVFVVACFDQYPFSLACALMGMETLMLKMAEDRPLVEALLARCAEYTVAYARALADAGADMLSGGDSPAGLLGPKRYRAIALPWEQRVIQQIRKTEPRPSGSVPGYGLRTRNISSTNNSDLCSTASARPLPVSLHICGNATPILPAMAQSGADVLELDHQVDLPGAAAITGPDLALWGNLDPVRVLSQGTPAQVRAATCALLESMAACGHRRFVLSSGCTLAVETPAENLDAMLNVARQANPNPL
jgi:uroporphyrinogen-III decarboxylase